MGNMRRDLRWYQHRSILTRTIGDTRSVNPRVPSLPISPKTCNSHRILIDHKRSDPNSLLSNHAVLSSAVSTQDYGPSGNINQTAPRNYRGSAALLNGCGTSACPLEATVSGRTSRSTATAVRRVKVRIRAGPGTCSFGWYAASCGRVCDCSVANLCIDLAATGSHVNNQKRKQRRRLCGKASADRRIVPWPAIHGIHGTQAPNAEVPIREQRRGATHCGLLL